MNTIIRLAAVLLASGPVFAADILLCREPASVMLEHQGGQDGFEGQFWGKQKWFHPVSPEARAALASLRIYDDLRYRIAARDRAARDYATARGLAGAASTIRRAFAREGMSVPEEMSGDALLRKERETAAALRSAKEHLARVQADLGASDALIQAWRPSAYTRLVEIRRARHEEWSRTHSTVKSSLYTRDAMNDLMGAIEAGVIPLTKGTDYKIYLYDFSAAGRTGNFPGRYDCGEI